jgi:hypothetical protein
MQALSEDPRHVDAAYAIAYLCYLRAGPERKDQYAFAFEFAGRALAVDPNDARALNMRGVVLRRLSLASGVDDAQSWQDSLEDLKTAAACLWRTLCAEA